MLATLYKWPLLLLLTFTQQEALLPSKESERALTAMSQVLNQVVTSVPLLEPESSIAKMNAALDRLERALTDGQLAFVNRKHSQTFEYEVQATRLFGEQPRLPPEDKFNENWRFKIQSFELKSHYLFVQAVTFKGSRTLRIKRVKLLLFDGTHQSFEFPDISGKGNGSEFEKRQYLNWLEITDKQGLPRVARLKAIEITGSAQDGNFSAVLGFKMRVPSYEVDVPTDALAIIAKMRRHWRTYDQAAKQLGATRQNIEILKRYLIQNQ